MEQQHPHEPHTQDDAVYINALVDRLAAQYLARTATPGPNGAPLTIERFHRLYRCVLAEGYGR
jgi:hypothetical protein